LGVVVEHAGALSAAVGLPEHARAVEDESHYQRTWDCAWHETHTTDQHTRRKTRSIFTSRQVL